MGVEEPGCDLGSNGIRATRKGARGNKQIWKSGHFLTASLSFSPDHMLRVSPLYHLSLKVSVDESNNMTIKRTREWARDHSSRDFYPQIPIPLWISLLERLVLAPSGEESPVDTQPRKNSPCFVASSRFPWVIPRNYTSHGFRTKLSTEGGTVSKYRDGTELPHCSV